MFKEDESVCTCWLENYKFLDSNRRVYCHSPPESSASSHPLLNKVSTYLLVSCIPLWSRFVTGRSELSDWPAKHKIGWRLCLHVILSAITIILFQRERINLLTTPKRPLSGTSVVRRVDMGRNQSQSRILSVGNSTQKHLSLNGPIRSSHRKTTLWLVTHFVNPKPQ